MSAAVPPAQSGPPAGGLPPSRLASEPASDPALAGPAPPPYRLFSAPQITVAAIFASPIAGGILLALNERRLGRRRQALSVLLWVIVGTALLFAVGEQVPSRAGRILPLGGAFIVYEFAKSRHPLFDQHLAAGGRKASFWSAAGWTLGTLALVFVALAPWAMGLGPFAPAHVAFGNERVIYETGATREDAQRVGDFLVSSGNLDGLSERDVRVSAKSGTFTVSYYADAKARRDAEYLQTCSRLRKELAMGPLRGHPVTLALLNDFGEVRKEFKGPAALRVDFGNEQAIEVEAPATEADARSLGAFLTDGGVFGPGRRPIGVALRKPPSGFVVSIVMDNTADLEVGAAEFESLRQHMAEKVFGGQPLIVELCDEQFKVRKAFGP